MMIRLEIDLEDLGGEINYHLHEAFPDNCKLPTREEIAYEIAQFLAIVSLRQAQHQPLAPKLMVDEGVASGALSEI
jgi:hypothetical protein